MPSDWAQIPEVSEALKVANRELRTADLNARVAECEKVDARSPARTWATPEHRAGYFIAIIEGRIKIGS